MEDRHIICMSGNRKLDSIDFFLNYIVYINSIIRKVHTKICFISSEDSYFAGLLFKSIIYLNFPKWTVKSLRQKNFMDEDLTFDCDMVCIIGYDIENLVNLFTDTLIPEKLKQAYENGIVMGGVNSGLQYWFDHTLYDKSGILREIKTLGLLKESCTPHFNDDERSYMFNFLIKHEVIPEGYGFIDGKFYHFINEKLHEEHEQYAYYIKILHN